MTGDVLVAGACLSGLTVAEVLRRKGFEGRLRLVGGEDRPPYDRPPLSKEVLTGRWPAERAQLRDEARLASLDAELLLGHRLRRLDLGQRIVELDDGRTLSFETLVVATGLVPRRLSELPGVSTFRTVDDALALRRELTRARRLAVVGAGVLG
ncbi:MAG: FAD-dependent oxidoreductase, partial [Stackebrandtia sp.]